MQTKNIRELVKPFKRRHALNHGNHLRVYPMVDYNCTAKTAAEAALSLAPGWSLVGYCEKAPYRSIREYNQACVLEFDGTKDRCWSDHWEYEPGTYWCHCRLDHMNLSPLRADNKSCTLQRTSEGFSRRVRNPPSVSW